MKKAKILLDKLKAGTLTEEERAQLDAWYNDHASSSSPLMDEEVFRRKMSELDSAFPFHQKRQSRRLSLWPRIAAAAAILVVLFGAGLWFFGGRPTDVSTGQLAGDIAPGKNGATLTLADGRKILINDALAGNVAEETGVRISKTEDGEITYEVLDAGSNALAYNTLTTTRGEQTKVRLPDGTLVFLNAESSLRYPNSFAKMEKRTVFLTGEGFFEVAKDKAHPFIVDTKGQSVEVLGTHFNINAYENSSAIKTTLLEGSVRISELSSKISKTLKPGQQAKVTNNLIDIAEVEVDDAVAWKNGKLIYDWETLDMIMADVSRWYNVDVIFKDDSIKKEEFFISVNRWDKVSKLLKVIEKTKGVVFEIKGNQITVDRRTEKR